jgi:hypothetical protein
MLRRVRTSRLKKMARKGDARKAVPLTIQQAVSAVIARKESIMKLRVLRAAYALAAVVSFVVAAGAGSKFH